MSEIDKLLELQILTLRDHVKKCIVPITYEDPKYYDKGVFYLRGHGVFFEKNTNLYFITSSHVFSKDAKINIDMNYIGIPLNPNNEALCSFGNFKIKINNDEQFDVSVIKILDEEIKDSVSNSWFILRDDNISRKPFNYNVFMIYGYPFEMCDSEGNKLIPSSLCLVTTHAMEELYRAYQKPPNFFLLLGHQKLAYNYNSKKQVELPILDGLSGTMIWGVDDHDKSKIWNAELSTKIVSVYLGHSDNNCMLSTKWCIIDKIINEFESEDVN